MMIVSNVHNYFFIFYLLVNTRQLLHRNVLGTVDIPYYQVGKVCLCKNMTLNQIPANVYCRCEKITYSIPSLPEPLITLHVAHSKITQLKKDFFQRYKYSLRDIAPVVKKIEKSWSTIYDSIQCYLSSMSNLEAIEDGTFHEIDHLRTIDIHGAPKLEELSDSLFNLHLSHLKTLRITQCGLKEIPLMNKLTTERPLHTIDLESNQLRHLSSNSITVSTEELRLGFNKIEYIADNAFNGAQIASLSLRGNKYLVRLSKLTFNGIHHLRKLDLSLTGISFLPTQGLHQVEILILEDTPTLKIFPSVYNFKSIQKASLTYSQHCCAFKFPDMHSPEDFKRHQEFLQRMKLYCKISFPVNDTAAAAAKETDIEPILKNEENYVNWQNLSGNTYHNFNNNKTVTISENPEEEIFHEGELFLMHDTPIYVHCGNFSKNYQQVKCIPEPDAFNPCEDLMGNWPLRIAIWIVATLAVLGNFFVLLVLISSTFRMPVPKFLICNLALADMLMGFYLILIAVMDAKSIGYHFNYAIDWQSGLGCKVAGFLTVLASELSIYTLAVITCERWYTITYAIHLNKRLKLRTAVIVMLIGWLYSVTMAVMPLTGISNYSKTSLCLPLENKEAKDTIFLATLLLSNGIAFLLICICYGRMYFSVSQGHEPVLTHSDIKIAKRMALLVFTDFACWAPITFFGFTALLGHPFIDVSKTKILLVFFYPLNSCANPYLYALLTQQYRRDLFIFLSRYGICTRRAARYKDSTGVATDVMLSAKSRPTGGRPYTVRFQKVETTELQSKEFENRESLLTSQTFTENVQTKSTSSIYSSNSKSHN